MLWGAVLCIVGYAEQNAGCRWDLVAPYSTISNIAVEVVAIGETGGKPFLSQEESHPPPPEPFIHHRRQQRRAVESEAEGRFV